MTQSKSGNIQVETAGDPSVLGAEYQSPVVIHREELNATVGSVRERGLYERAHRSQAGTAVVLVNAQELRVREARRRIKQLLDE